MRSGYYEVTNPSIHCDIIRNPKETASEIFQLELNRPFEPDQPLFRCTVVLNKVNLLVFTVDKRISDGNSMFKQFAFTCPKVRDLCTWCKK
jgi:hypothetical protein